MSANEEGMLREILTRMVTVEVELKTVNREIKELKENSKAFSKEIAKITLDYQQAKGAIQLANWIALAVIALTAGLGSIWLTNLKNNNVTPYQHQNEQKNI